jgi:hypothetical protein
LELENIMAKKKVNKTAAVKAYLEANPNAGPTEVVAALAEHKISVTPNYVSNIKSKGKSGGKQVKRRGRKKATVQASTGGLLSGRLAEAIKLVEKVGGIDKAVTLEACPDRGQVFRAESGVNLSREEKLLLEACHTAAKPH